MRGIALGATLTALLSAPVVALTVSNIDTDSDNLVSFVEVAEFHPDLTEETFAEINTGGDEFADEDERATALESDLIEEPAE